MRVDVGVNYGSIRADFETPVTCGRVALYLIGVLVLGVRLLSVRWLERSR